MVDRRTFLKASAAAALVPLAGGCGREAEKRWEPAAYTKPARSRVAILRAAGYDRPLRDTIVAGLRLFPLSIAGRKVVLKPNLVEFDPNGVINTHPALIAATIEALRSLGAREVVIAEGPGHRRDNEYLLAASGLREVLAEYDAPYVDLNHDSVRAVRLQSHFTDLPQLYLPETVLDADLFISMPKLKTHKWVGATLSMKNLFGIVPGSVYGWPKNVLHWQGVGESILDINSALAMPRFNIVDGIVGMEGNGPIQGTAKHSGALIFGADPVAVDATCARLMSLDPWKVGYLQEAEAYLGNVAEEGIEQVGEDLTSMQQDYAVIESFQHLKGTPLAKVGAR